MHEWITEWTNEWMNEWRRSLERKPLPTTVAYLFIHRFLTSPHTFKSRYARERNEKKFNKHHTELHNNFLSDIWISIMVFMCELASRYASCVWLFGWRWPCVLFVFETHMRDDAGREPTLERNRRGSWGWSQGAWSWWGGSRENGGSGINSRK